MAQEYSAAETITQPDGAGTFIDSNGNDTHSRIRNVSSGEIPNPSTLQLGIVGGISWRFPLNRRGTLVLAPEAKVDFEQLTRHVFTSSSCGMCGKASIDSVFRRFEPVKSDVTVDARTLLALPDRLRQAQATFDRTGGLHGVAIFTGSGELLVAREDVGRHNAVDKVLGHGLLRGMLPFDRHVLMVSGRVSFEIVQKALAAGIPIVAAVSAPSTLAAEFAEESGQTLVGFLRDPRMNVYTHPQRICFA